MVITYHGGECFKVSSGDTTLAFNPISKTSKLKEAKFGADIAFVSANHPDFNGVEQVTYGERVPFVVDGPGEYEVGEVIVKAFGVQTWYDGKDLINTIFYVSFEGINILFLGALGTPTLDARILGELGDTDILFVPIGGESKETKLLGPSDASALGVKLEARAIIPMHFDEKTLKTFAKEEGVDAKPQEKFTIKKKDLALMTGEIVLLSA